MDYKPKYPDLQLELPSRINKLVQELMGTDYTIGDCSHEGVNCLYWTFHANNSRVKIVLSDVFEFDDEFEKGKQL